MDKARHGPLPEEAILDIYRGCDAVWFFNYESDPKAPHVELVSGRCSDGYINSMPVLADPLMTRALASELIARLRPHEIQDVTWVVGSAYAAITFSYEVARQLGVRHGFVEKDPENPKKMLWQRLTIPRGSVLLNCEELITTRLTTLAVRAAITRGNAEPVIFHPVIATAIYRPAELDDPAGDNIVALVRRAIKNWEPGECPLCRAGSPRFRPKTHWRELTGR